MKLMIIGKSGQVARELAQIVPQALFVSRAELDLEDAAACARLVAQAEADAVINAAAYTAVERAEAEAARAFAVNGIAPGAMARAAAARGLPFVQLSSDYVFGGQGNHAFAPQDPPAPLNIYGQSKLQGEQGVRAAGGVHVILRTSWVFSAFGGNFMKTMLHLANHHDRLDVVADQVGGPTPAAAIAKALTQIATRLIDKRGPSGTYHFAGAPDASWAEFARTIFSESGKKVLVREISARDYPTRALRPENSRLDCSSLARDYGIERPDWRKALPGIMAQLREQER